MGDRINPELSELFPMWKKRSRPTRKELISLVPDTFLVTQILLDLGLSYMGDEEISSNNVCMANADEVLQAYRSVVTRLDLINYVLNAVHESDAMATEEADISITAPHSSADFWDGVEKGMGRS